MIDYRDFNERKQAGDPVDDPGHDVDPPQPEVGTPEAYAQTVLEEALAEVKRGNLAAAAVPEWVAARIATRSPQENPFEANWTPISSDWLSVEPPPRDWLLRRPAFSANDSDGEVLSQHKNQAKSAGYFPSGKVGMLVAAGGAGKSMALVQLGLAVVTGENWLNTYSVPTTGKVLLALGEEDAAEVRRRVYAASKVMWREEQRRSEWEQKVARDLVALPLAGKPVAFVRSDRRSGVVIEEPALAQLRAQINEHGPFRLIVLDPLSRFAGPDTEIDNAAATRFVQAIESLTQLEGSPSVMLAHHSTKAGRKQDSAADASNARGASALTDGVRWAIELRVSGDEEARNALSLEMTKTNYTTWAPKLNLVREQGGALRACTTPENIERTIKSGGNRPRETEKTNGTPSAQVRSIVDKSRL